MRINDVERVIQLTIRQRRDSIAHAGNGRAEVVGNDGIIWQFTPLEPGGWSRECATTATENCKAPEGTQ